MRFDWDENKAESNFHKHGITFDNAVTIFADPYLLFTEDVKHSEEEEREWGIGESENGLIIVVVFTVRGDTFRIISAVKSNKKRT